MTWGHRSLLGAARRVHDREFLGHLLPGARQAGCDDQDHHYYVPEFREHDDDHLYHVNLDTLSSYMHEKTLPGQMLDVQVIRSGQTMTVKLVLGTRPPPPSS